MKMLKKHIKIDVLFYFSALIFFIPSILINHQMWDGVIIDYNVTAGNIDIIKNWFYSTKWPYQFWQIYLFKSISEYINISYSFINSFSILFSIILIAHETYFIAAKLFNINRDISKYAILLIGLFPSWHILLSSVMAFHIICLALGIIGARFIHSKKYFYIILGYLFCIIGLGYPGNLLLIPSVVFCYEIKTYNFQNFYRTILILLISVSTYFSNKYLHDGGILYDDYNNIINPFDFDNIYLIGICILNFGSYFLPLVFPLFFYYIFVERLKLKYDTDLFIILLIIIAAVLPFIFVGKSSRISYYYEWTNRQSFPLSIGLILFYVYICNKFIPTVKIANYILIFISFCFFVFSILGLNNKILKYSFENDLIEKISTNIDSIPEGKVCLYGYNTQPKSRFYELNYIFYLSSGRNGWWVDYCIPYSNSRTFDKFSTFGKFYIYTPPNTKVTTENSIDLSYSDIDDTYFYKRLLGFSDNKLSLTIH